MTYSNPPYPPNTSPVYGAPARTSGLAIGAFICSVLICIPGITSIVGLILSIPAIVVTGKPNVRGRGLAIAALIVALLGIGLWSAVGYKGYLAYVKYVEPAKTVVLFSHEAEQGHIKEALAMSVPPIDEAQVIALSAKLQGLGKFIKLDPVKNGKMPFANNVVNGIDVYTGEGTLIFDNGRQNCSIELQHMPGGWKVSKFEMTDVPPSVPGKGMEDFSDKPPVPPTQPARP